MEPLINKVAQSGLVEFNLEEYYPKGERVLWDMKDHLIQGLLLKEKDFREFVKTEDWQKYRDKFVALTCTADAVVPSWAYMLVVTALEPYAGKIVFGDLKILESALFADSLAKIDVTWFAGKKIMIRGCSKLPVPESAFVEITRMLRPVAGSLMYGEACSTVPLFKRGNS